MTKYVVFQYNGRRTWLNRANIVGFETPDGRLIWTNVILDSGATIPLNGMHFEEAEKTLREYDECATKS